jgi:hypothetical protein
MKKYLLSFFFIYLPFIAYGQNVVYSTSESSIFENGMVYSKNGFILYHVNAKKDVGYYSKDGKILVASSPFGNDEYFVAYGTEAIAANAFRGTIENLYLPSTVKYIHPSAFSNAMPRIHINDVVTKKIKEVEEDKK